MSTRVLCLSTVLDRRKLLWFSAWVKFPGGLDIEGLTKVDPGIHSCISPERINAGRAVQVASITSTQAFASDSMVALGKTWHSILLPSFILNQGQELP